MMLYTNIQNVLQKRAPTLTQVFQQTYASFNGFPKALQRSNNLTVENKIESQPLPW